MIHRRLRWFFIWLSLFCMENQANEYHHSCEYPDSQSQITALACNIYFESRDQPIMGRMAVGFVTLNRSRSVRFPNSVIKVVYEYRQFSWTKDGKSDRVYDIQAWSDALNLSDRLLSISPTLYSLFDITDGSLFYHNHDVSPDWASQDYWVVTISGHIFYDNDVKSKR